MIDPGSKELIDKALTLEGEQLEQFLAKLPPRTLSYFGIILNEYERDVLNAGSNS